MCAQTEPAAQGTDSKVEAPAPAANELALEKVNTVATDAALAGNNAWMLVSCALVLFMTAPGLAMFYGGLVRKKNVLGVIMQCIFLMCMMTVIWALIGFSLAFGAREGDGAKASTAKYIGNGDYALMKGVESYWDDKDDKGKTKELKDQKSTQPAEGAIPRMTFMLFQGMFFIITPALICGAFAERMKFSAMVVFTALWGLLVYCPLCHWVWASTGWFFYKGDNAMFHTDAIPGGALDFAGGTVVHISSGISALICALLIGKRLGYGTEDMRPHNLTYTALGAAMLWVGWFGFNAGSAGASNGLASSAFMVTHFAAAAGGIAWAVAEWITRGKPSVLGAASGVVAGLVCITPASGFVNAMPALLMGAAAGVVCFIACSTVKAKFKYDDALDAFGVHGVGGTLGAVLTGVFATRAVNNVNGGNPVGLLEGGTIMGGQLAAVGVTWVFSIVVTFILLKLIDVSIGLRVTKEQELQGLDITQHGEEGYIFS